MPPVFFKIAVLIHIAPARLRQKSAGNGNVIIIKLGFALVQPGIRRHRNITGLRAVHVNICDDMSPVDRIGKRHANTRIAQIWVAVVYEHDLRGLCHYIEHIRDTLFAIAPDGKGRCGNKVELPRFVRGKCNVVAVLGIKREGFNIRRLFPPVPVHLQPHKIIRYRQRLVQPCADRPPIRLHDTAAQHRERKRIERRKPRLAHRYRQRAIFRHGHIFNPRCNICIICICTKRYNALICSHNIGSRHGHPRIVPLCCSTQAERPNAARIIHGPVLRKPRNDLPGVINAKQALINERKQRQHLFRSDKKRIADVRIHRHWHADLPAGNRLRRRCCHGQSNARRALRRLICRCAAAAAADAGKGRGQHKRRNSFFTEQVLFHRVPCISRRQRSPVLHISPFPQTGSL